MNAKASYAASAIKTPLLIYFGDAPSYDYAKTGLGLIQWRRGDCLGQLRLPGCDVDGGLEDLSIEAAVAAGAKSLVIGVANTGGVIPDVWIDDLANAARAGLDVVSGMHMRLGDLPVVAAAAEQSGARLIDIRTPPKSLPVGTGRKRTGRRLLAVGSDCAVGKKYTALAIEKEMCQRGMKATFRATGQTGIMIAGQGIPLDSVVSDFLSGAAELISPDAEPDHWDVIEGQGSLIHPSFAAVSLGLLHGSQPDALVLCHEVGRTHCIDLEPEGEYSIPPLQSVMDLNILLARRVNPAARFVGVSLNTSALTKAERARTYEVCVEQYGLPVIDPLIDGAGEIVDKIEAEFCS